MAMLYQLEGDRKREGELEVNREVCQWPSSSCSPRVERIAWTSCRQNFYKSHLTWAGGALSVSLSSLSSSYSSAERDDESRICCGKQATFSHALAHKHHFDPRSVSKDHNVSVSPLLLALVSAYESVYCMYTLECCVNVLLRTDSHKASHLLFWARWRSHHIPAHIMWLFH